MGAVYKRINLFCNKTDLMQTDTDNCCIAGGSNPILKLKSADRPFIPKGIHCNVVDTSF